LPFGELKHALIHAMTGAYHAVVSEK